MALLQKLTGNKKIKLTDIDPNSDGGLEKVEAEKRTLSLCQELDELQELQYAAQTTPVLVVLQGMDTSGKDGTISHVMRYMNPQSCRVASFKAPTPVELAHDFLWRVHSETPGKGMITIFNRSHYEDVLVVRVHKLIPRNALDDRYDQINSFEKLLTDAETVIVKFMLHIDKDEQKKRLLEREQDPTKAWKLSAADWHERELWDDYQEAFEVALNRCSTPRAPWYVVPANHKWFRDLAVAETLVETLRPFRKQWELRLKEIGVEELKNLRAMRQSH
ncbi:MAG: Polyphosphate:AMP phosphotransferase [Chthonomonadaceae bacterium]|nr:Polyphosphate:AMP phosphotransferase [Chthonomonadaceae bacterium]